MLEPVVHGHGLILLPEALLHQAHRCPLQRRVTLRYAPVMSNLTDIMDAPLLAVWGESVRARRIQGDHITLAVVELGPDAVVPEHHHAAEQLGMVMAGEMHFTIDGETRTLGPGGTWRILSDRPHHVTAGPNGAVVIDVFSPIRTDWDDLPTVPDAAPRWPATDPD